MSRPLLTDDDKQMLPPLGSVRTVPARLWRVPIILEGANGWTYYLLEGGEVPYGYECYAIVDGVDCEVGAVPIEVSQDYGPEEGVDYQAHRGLVWRRPNHDPNTTLVELAAGELKGKVNL